MVPEDQITPVPRRGRRALRVLRRLASALVLAMVAIVVLLQIEPVRTWAVNAVLGAINPYPESTLRVRSTEGSVVGSLEVLDLALTRRDGSRPVSITSAYASYQLLPLLTGSVRLSQVTVDGLVVQASRDSTGALDLLVPFLSDDTSATDLRLDRLRIARSALSVRDSVGVWAIDSLAIALEDLALLPSFQMRLDSLSGTISDPVSGTPGRLFAAGSVMGSAARLDSLYFRTSRSLLRASGRASGLAWPADSLHLDIEADPLHTDDLWPLVTTLRRGQTVSLSSSVRSEGRQASLALDAILGGGSVTARLDAAIPTDASPLASVAGTLRSAGVDLNRVLSDLPEATPLSLEADLDLRGASWTALSGRAALQLQAMRLTDVSLSGVSIRSTWVEGAITADGSGSINGGAVTFRGTTQPFSDDFPVRATAMLDDWPLERWTDGALDGVLAGSVSAVGSVSSGGWAITSNLAGSRIGRCLISGTTRAAITATEVRANTALDACDGRLEAAGQYRTNGSWRVDSLVASDLAFNQALSDTTGGRINLVAQGRGSEDGYTARVRGGLASYGDYRIDSLSADVSGLRAAWTAAGSLWSGPGAARFSVEGSPDGGTIREVVLRGIDAAYTAGLADLSTSLSGRIGGTFMGDGARLVVDIDTSAVNAQRLTGGRGTVVVQADSVEAHLLLDLDGIAGIRLAAVSRAGMTRLDSLSFTNLNLASLIPGQAATSLTGLGTGLITDSLQSVRLELAASGHYDHVPIRGGRAAGFATADSVWFDFRAALGDGTVEGAGGLHRGLERYAARVSAYRLDALRLARLDTVGSAFSGVILMNGEGLDPATATWDAQIDSIRLAYRAADVDSARGRIRWRAGVVNVDSLRIYGTPLRAVLHGQIPVGADAPDQRYTLLGTIEGDNVRQVAALAGIEVSTADSEISIRGSGRPGRFQLSTEGAVQGIRYNGVNIARSDIRASAELGTGLRPNAAEVTVRSSVLSLPGMAAQSGSARLSLVRDSLLMEFDLTIDGRRSITARADANRSLTRFHLSDLSAVLDDASWSLLAPSEISLDDGIEISGLVAVADSQRIAIGGRTMGSAGDDLYFRATNVRLDAAADILGYAGFGATLNTSLVMSSSGPEEPRAVSGTVSGAIRHRGRPAGTIDARVSHRQSRLNIDGSLLHADGSLATLRGFLPFAGTEDEMADQPVSLRLESGQMPIDWTLPFFDPLLVDGLGGKIQASVSIRGTYSVPVVSGEARLSQGRIAIPMLGKARNSLVYERASARLTFIDQGIRVDSMVVHSGSGTASLTGLIDLQDLTLGEINLNVVAQNFLAIDSDEYRAIVGAQMTLQGTNLAPRLSGRVRVEQGDFYLTDENTAEALEPVTLTDRDLLTLEERFGIRVTEADTTTFDFYEAMEITDLRVDLARNSWLRAERNPAMDIQFNGSVDVSKRPHGDLRIFGTIEVIPDRSRIDQFGRRFEIERGTLTFNGPATEPDLDLGAVYQVRSRRSNGNEVTIRLQADGSPENLNVSFQSDPAMDLADIVSYIATGRPASESLQFGGTSSEDYLRSAAGLAVGPITSLVENLAGSGLGLDVVEIEQDQSSGLMLTAGKYVSPRFFVSVSQPLSLTSSSGSSSSAATEVNMEYELVRSVLISLMNRGTILRVNLRWQRAY